MQVGTQRRGRHVDDRDIEDGHELPDEDGGEQYSRPPGADAVTGCTGDGDIGSGADGGGASGRRHGFGHGPTLAILGY
jgi:hypothetical protein